MSIVNELDSTCGVSDDELTKRFKEAIRIDNEIKKLRVFQQLIMMRLQVEPILNTLIGSVNMSLKLPEILLCFQIKGCGKIIIRDDY